MVGTSKTNIWLIGDGKGKTIITGSKSVLRNNVTTLKTPTFGKYIARSISPYFIFNYKNGIM